MSTIPLAPGLETGGRAVSVAWGLGNKKSGDHEDTGDHHDDHVITAFEGGEKGGSSKVTEGAKRTWVHVSSGVSLQMCDCRQQPNKAGIGERPHLTTAC